MGFRERRTLDTLLSGNGLNSFASACFLKSCKCLLEGLPREQSECSGYHYRVCDACNGIESTTVCFTDRNIDIEHSLEALCFYARGAGH